MSNLNELIISDRTKVINAYAFSGRSDITSVCIPESVSRIDDNAFEFCSNLEVIKFKAIGSIAFGKDVFLEDRKIANIIMMNNNHQLSSQLLSVFSQLDINFNPTDENYSNSLITEISVGQKECSSCGFCADCKNLSAVRFKNDVTSIADYMFRGCSSLSSIQFPRHLKYIGKNAFEKCVSISEVLLPRNLAIVCNNAFSHCSHMTDLSVMSSKCIIGKQAFAYCNSLSSVSLLNSNNLSIESDAFYANEKLHLSSSLAGYSSEIDDVVIRKNEFKGAHFSKFIVPDRVTEIKKGAFENCIELSSVQMSSSLTVIKKNAFMNCTKLLSVKLPDSLQQIDEFAFYGCINLTAVNIPDNIQYIGPNAFGKCNLKVIYGSKEQLKRFESRFKNFEFQRCSFHLDAAET